VATGSSTPGRRRTWQHTLDLRTGTVVLRCNSSGDLYPLHSSAAASPTAFVAVTADLWHERLGHPGRAALSHVLDSFDFHCNKATSHTCHACQLAKHVRLPFSESFTIAPFPFHTIHCDVWTSP
uniref:GAG-pre-integrase domain-containing protein n=1 Tax=Aegilops tauschii subsp. strangulata TaxID=200361 RepID=A0A453Q3J2_AEGTS